MPFRNHSDIFSVLFKRHEGDEVLFHQLQSHRPADQRRQLLRADGDILLNLHSAKPIAAAFGLYRDNVVRPASIHTDVDLVRFHLAQSESRRSQVILK